MSTARGVLTGSHSNTILTRQVSLPNNSPVFSSAQAQVDQLSSQFIAQASDWKSVAALMAGGMAYRLGKSAVMNLGVGAHGRAPVRVLAIAAGLSTEVGAFEFTNRTLQTFRAHGRAPLQTMYPNLWVWSEHGGWKEGFLSSLITFSLLKGAGHLARQENFILQQLFPATAMVLGHHAGSRLKVTPAPEGTLPRQFTHALVTNLQLLSGLSLAHSLTGGRLLALEKGLDLKTHVAFHERKDSFSFLPDFQKMSAVPSGAKISENGKTSPLLWMSRPKDPSQKKPSGSSPPTVDSQHPLQAAIQDPIDRIRRASAAFFFPIDSEQALKFEKDLEILNGHPDRKLEPSDLRLALTFQAAPFLEQGFDPMMVLHNTGADFFQLSELIAGEGRGGFPMSFSLEISGQDSIAAALERFAVSRQTPNFSLHLQLPASHLAAWAVENREAPSPNQDPFREHDLPTERIPSLMKRALEKGSAKILVLPGTYPREVEYVSKALEQAGFPSDVIVEAGGKDFWEVLALDRQETRTAAARWAETLVGHSQRLKEELIESWIDWIQEDFQEAPPANLLELGNWMEKQSTHFQWPLPPPDFLKEIHSRLLIDLEKKIGSRNDSGPDGKLLTLLIAGAGIATLLSSEPAQAAVREGMNAVSKAGLFGLLAAGCLALWGMALGGKEARSEQVQRSLKEAIDLQLRRRMGVGLPAVNHEFTLTLDRQTGEVIEREFNVESRETQIHWLKISLKVDEAGAFHLAEHDRERLLWQLSRSDNPSERREVLKGILKLEGKFNEEESTQVTPLENQIPSEETTQKNLGDLAPTRASSPIPSQGKFSANEPLGLRIIRTLLLENPLMPLSAERREEIFDYFKALALDPETPFPPWIMDLAYRGKASGGVNAFLIPDFPRYQGNQSLRPMRVLFTDPQQLILTLQTLSGNEPVQSLLFRSEVGPLPFVRGDTVYIYLPPS